MTANQGSAARVWSSLRGRVDSLLPPPSATGGDRVSRARLAASIGFLLVPVFAALALAHFSAGRTREGLINLALGAVTGVAGALARRPAIYPVVLNVTLAIATLGIGAILAFDRGAGLNAGSVALAEIPLFATLLGGVRLGALWASISAGLSTAIALAAWRGLVVGKAEGLLDDQVVIVVVTGTLFLVAALYERDRGRSVALLAELEERRLRTEIERVRATSDARVAQAERLASLGRIASAVGHEINNPLSYAQNNLDYLASTLGEHASDEQRAAVQESLDGLRRVRGIVADLHQFTRPEESTGEGGDVLAAMEAALKMAASHLRSKATVETHLPASARARGDADRLTQVFLNLLVNAAQAMPEGHASDNRVDVRVDERGDEIVVEIEDTGEGIPPDVVHCVTDPFFSSKPTGEGLGLGLAVSHAILESIGGKLEFESRPGRTVARVRLARVASPARDAAPPSSAVLPPEVSDTRLSILIVDDEVLVARALKRNLRGHDVTTAGSGREALAMLEEGRTFDLVLCDMMMPELSGMDLFAEVQKKYPALSSRFVFMTGGTFTARATEFRESTENVFLSKPLDPTLVQAQVRKAISRRARAAAKRA